MRVELNQRSRKDCLDEITATKRTILATRRCSDLLSRRIRYFDRSLCFGAAFLS
jgi:hypothetical protein